MRAAGAREDARREHMKTRRQIYNELRQEQASRTAALNEAAEASKNAGSSSRPWGRGGESRSRAW